ncbi:hypothetical protein ANN_17626 [Periplaneta americana]|uniref:Uncharacterized protein n=1 Tax=Periplaneta americana TaxID=6978 RepID=A0ABQ8SUW7_PERAM|nr:hypothetical protein ANN_17626 [Periplaneta americana]
MHPWQVADSLWSGDESMFLTAFCTLRPMGMSFPSDFSSNLQKCENHMEDAGLKNYIAVKKIYLTYAQIFDHLAYATEMLNFVWGNVVFSDEVTFSDRDVGQLHQDNHPVHTPMMVQQWFDWQQRIKAIPWSPNSLDLNPVENTWDLMEKTLRKCSCRPTTKNELWPRNYITAASFHLPHCIAQHGKSLSDGEFLKEAFLLTSGTLFEDFLNKQIIKRIQEMPTSRNTVEDRIIRISEYVLEQVKAGLDNAQIYSICINESTALTLQARLAVFVRFPYGNVIRVELIKLLSLLTTTTGKDIMKEVKQELVLKMGFDLQKIVSVTTIDAVPSTLDIHNSKNICKKYVDVLQNSKQIVSTRFSQFRDLEKTLQFISKPHIAQMSDLKVSFLEWLDIDHLEMEFIEFHESSTWMDNCRKSSVLLMLITLSRS